MEIQWERMWKLWVKNQSGKSSLSIREEERHSESACQARASTFLAFGGTAMSRLHRFALPVLIVIEFLIACHTAVSSQSTTRSIDETTEVSPKDNSTKIYYYIIGILLGLTIILLIILFITCWIKAKKKGNSDNTSTTTTYKDEKFSDWFAFGKKNKAGNSPQKGIMNEDTRNGKTQDTTFNPVTGEGGYSKYFDAKK